MEKAENINKSLEQSSEAKPNYLSKKYRRLPEQLSKEFKGYRELVNDLPFVPLGLITELDMQTQYSSRYTDGSLGAPNLGVGLRFKGSALEYHTLKIHVDDIAEFVKRVLRHIEDAGGCLPSKQKRILRKLKTVLR